MPHRLRFIIYWHLNCAHVNCVMMFHIRIHLRIN